MVNFPKYVFVRRIEEDGDDSYLLVDEELAHADAGQKVAEYKLVRIGKIAGVPVEVDWK